MDSARKEKRSFDKLRTSDVLGGTTSTSSGSADLVVLRSSLEAMLSATKAAHPREACGLLLGEGGRVTQFLETANVHASPATHFEVDPQALIDAHRAARKGGPQVLGYFHSHPGGRPEPSPTDIAQSPKDGKVWAIGVSSEITFWCDQVTGFCPLSYSVTQA